MDSDTLLELVCLALGIAGALFARQLPASGKVAFVLSLVPWLGVALAMKFC